MSSTTLDITLQGREYRVACGADEREALLAAVALVDGKMNELAKKTKTTGERLAVMTALNLAGELTSLNKTPAPALDTPDARRRIKAMEARLDAALAEQEKLF